MNGKDYYENIKAKGLDYNFYGDWQKAYGKMIVSISGVMQKVQKGNLSLLDVGVACGVNLRGIKETGIFKHIVGIDSNEYMIDIGKKAHGFTDDELMVIDANDIMDHFEPDTFDMVHCAQMLEHIPEKNIPKILNSFNEVLSPNGVIFIILDTVTEAQSAEALASKDPTHITLKTRKWWQEKISVAFKIDQDAHQRFARTKFSPNNTKQTFFDYYKEQWTLFVGTKKVM